jgi:hypothetical protein
MFQVQLEENCYIAPWPGDPGRTTERGLARTYKTLKGAQIALGKARRYRPFRNAKIVFDFYYKPIGIQGDKNGKQTDKV